MAQYLIEIPDDTPEEALRQAVARMTDYVQWVATSPLEVYDNEWMFTNDQSWEQISKSVQEAMTDITQDGAQWPPYPYAEWSIEQRRLLVRMAVSRWGHLGPNGADSSRLERDYRAGLLDPFRQNPDRQAIVTTDRNRMERLALEPNVLVEPCVVFDNGVAIYDDEGHTIMQRYAEKLSVEHSRIPDWDELSQVIQHDPGQSHLIRGRL